MLLSEKKEEMGQSGQRGNAEIEDFSAKRIGQINLKSGDWSEQYETGLMLQKLIGSFGRSSLKADFRAMEGEGVTVSDCQLAENEVQGVEGSRYVILILPSPTFVHLALAANHGNYHASPS